MSKVMFIINDGVYPYQTGGMEVFNYHLIKALSLEMPVSYMASRRYDFESAEYIRSCSLRPTKLFTPLWMLIYLMFHREYRQVVISFSAAHWLVWKIYYWAVRLLKLKTTVVIHYGKEVPADHFSVYRDFLKAAENVVAVSEDIKKNYDAAYSVDCKVIYPLIPFTEADKDKSYCRAKYHIPADCNVISMVGSLKEMKNPQRIIEALHLFDKEELSRYRPYVVYAGDGPMRGELEYLVEEKGLSDHVRFLGLIPNSCVREIMAMTDIYLISSDFEGTSVSLLEAMFNSKTIVASDVPGLQDMIENGKEGMLYDVKSSQQLKNCLIELMDSKSEAERLGKAARHRFEASYDYSDVIEEYKSMLK